MNWCTFKNFCNIDAIVINSNGTLTFYDKWNGLFALGQVTNVDEYHRTIQIYIAKGTTQENIIRKALRQVVCNGDRDVFKEFQIIPTFVDYEKWTEIKKNHRFIYL